MTTRRLFVALFAIALFTMAIRETLDPDMWWHLRTGQYILERGLPRQDLFSFTVPDHEWITHEWLSQAFMWVVYRIGAWSGLMIVFAVLIAITHWMIYRCSEGKPYLAAFVVLSAAFTSAVVWGVRPQIFNLLFTASFVYIVESYKNGRVKRRVLWTLPLLTALWANFHSGYLLGIVLLCTYLAGEALQRWRGGEIERTLEWPQIRYLGMVTIVAFLMAAINPSGPELWLYPFSTLGSPAMQSNILEWHSPDFHQTYFWPFGAMMALGVLSLVFSPKRATWSELLLFLGTAAAGHLSARNVPIFAIISAPIIARHLTEALHDTLIGRLLNQQTTAAPTPRIMLLINWSLLLLALLASGAWTLTKASGNEAAVAEQYPVAAVDFLEASGLAKERGFNSYNWGGYLIWRGLPVFVDGRADVYGDDFLFYYLQSYRTQTNWQEPLDEHSVDYVLMERDSPLSVLLAGSREWQEAYKDDIARIFVRAE